MVTSASSARARGRHRKGDGRALEHWAAVTRFREVGWIRLSDNAPARAPNVFRSGRKSRLSCKTDRGGERAAIRYSRIQSARLNDVDPRAWFAGLPVRIAADPASKRDDPRRWKRNRDDVPAPRLQRLDARLAVLSGAQDGPRTLSAPDGFVAGIPVCPEMILPAEWRPVVLADDGTGGGTPTPTCGRSRARSKGGRAFSILRAATVSSARHAGDAAGARSRPVLECETIAARRRRPAIRWSTGVGTAGATSTRGVEPPDWIVTPPSTMTFSAVGVVAAGRPKDHRVPTRPVEPPSEASVWDWRARKDSNFQPPDS